MSMGTLTMVADAVSGKLIGGDCHFESVSTDTRTLQPRDLFFALRGERFDAAAFVAAAAQAGAAGAVVEQRQDSELPQVEVADTRAALMRFGRAWRERLHIPVVGVTGSNGKTTVKEMIASILSADNDLGDDAVLVTRGNLNNEIGVPLTLLRLRDSHRVAVIEMGASHRGDIRVLAELAQPTIGVVTNAAPAHLEGFGSVDDVAATKGEMFSALSDDGIAIVNRDDVFFDYWRGLCGERRMLTFGMDEHADFRASRIDENDSGSGFELTFVMYTPVGELAIRLPMAGRHNARNALAAAAAATAAGASPEAITAGLAGLSNVAGRLRPIHLPRGIQLFDDSYNANPGSVQAAIHFLAGRPGETWLVLGDMKELGATGETLHAMVGETARDERIDRLYCVGPASRAAAEAFGDHARWFESAETLIDALQSSLHDDVSILVKGSRSMGLEQVVAAIESAARAHGGESA